MAKKHQIIISSKRNRSRAERKWRRIAKQTLTCRHPKNSSKDKKRHKKCKHNDAIIRKYNSMVFRKRGYFKINPFSSIFKITLNKEINNGQT